MNRTLFKLPFRSESFPRWRCPTCIEGVLDLAKGTFRKEQCARSRQRWGHEGWGPEWTEYVYSCVLKCAHPPCQEVVVTGGLGFVDLDVEYDQQGNPDQNFTDLFYPRYFLPHLKIIDIPKQTPKDVTGELNQSFALFFINPASAANHVRIALENILTDLKVKLFETACSGRKILTLHRRVDLLPSKYEHLKDLCLAIKWLGNAGSHSKNEVTLDDVMDAYELMEVVLTQLYDPKGDSVKKLVKEINKKKGPARLKRKSGKKAKS